VFLKCKPCLFQFFEKLHSVHSIKLQHVTICTIRYAFLDHTTFTDNQYHYDFLLIHFCEGLSHSHHSVNTALQATGIDRGISYQAKYVSHVSHLHNVGSTLNSKYSSHFPLLKIIRSEKNEKDCITVNLNCDATFVCVLKQTHKKQ